jgi:5-methylcytosine-specific restriction endonuclease McrA
MAKKSKKSGPIESIDDPRFKSFLMAALRQQSRYWFPKTECLKNARVDRGKYQCAICPAIVGPKDIKADHINPVIPLEGFDSWSEVIKRIFCGVEGYQALCKPCHDIKTKEENTKRKSLRKEKAVLQYYKDKQRKDSA